jgi:eukaryotic-like serine/threonine-protein kinase
MSSTPDPEPPSGLIAGKFRVTRLLGRGGMGSVWEGIHESLGTRVAVKFIDTEYASSDDVRQRFVNEARAAARLRSKHVVQVYDQGVGDDGRPYIVMEFLAGEPLDHRLDRLGRLTPREAARVALHVCRALAKAHESGIVHRDLKPENVFLVHDEEDQTDVAKVVDFGIAKFTEASGTGSSSTRTGAVLGTPQYMSPEQARGLRSVDHRTDLWSLGVIVYRAIVGEMPFRGEAVGDLLVNICTGEAPAPSSVASDVPAGFDEWVRRALAREPSERFQSAAELADSLASICGLETRLGGAPASRDHAVTPVRAVTPGAVTASPLETTPSPSPGRRVPVAGLAALFAVVLAIAVVGARAVKRADAGPEPVASVLGAAAAPSAAPPVPAPEVTPNTSVVVPSAAPSVEHAPLPVEPGKRRPRASPSPAGAEAQKRVEPPALKASRPKDLLGY